MRFRNDIQTPFCKPPVQTPFCIVMDTVLGLVQDWKSQNYSVPNQMPETSEVMNSTKALYNLSLVSKAGKATSVTLIHPKILLGRINSTEQQYIQGSSRTTLDFSLRLRYVEITPTHTSLQLGRRINGKTKDDNLGSQHRANG